MLKRKAQLTEMPELERHSRSCLTAEAVGFEIQPAENKNFMEMEVGLRASSA